MGGPVDREGRGEDDQTCRQRLRRDKLLSAVCCDNHLDVSRVHHVVREKARPNVRTGWHASSSTTVTRMASSRRGMTQRTTRVPRGSATITRSVTLRPLALVGLTGAVGTVQS